MGIVTDVQRIGATERSTDNLTRRALKATEEVGELAEAVLSLTSESKGKGKHYMDMVEEAADVVIMGLDIALTKPPEMEMDDEMWRAVVKKIIGLKLEKWRKQVEKKGTLIKGGTIDFDPSELDEYLDHEDRDMNSMLDDANAYSAEMKEKFGDPASGKPLTDAQIAARKGILPEGDGK